MTTTQVRTQETVARAIARETGWHLDEDAEERGWAAIGVGPVGRHRDSEALDRSNFAVIFKDLSDRYSNDVDIVRFWHWAVGWVEEIIHNVGNADLRAAVTQWREKLDDYPVADEADWSEREWEENHPDGDECCYSEDEDCGCGRKKA